MTLTPEDSVQNYNMSSSNVNGDLLQTKPQPSSPQTKSASQPLIIPKRKHSSAQLSGPTSISPSSPSSKRKISGAGMSGAALTPLRSRKSVQNNSTINLNNSSGALFSAKMDSDILATKKSAHGYKRASKTMDDFDSMQVHIEQLSPKCEQICDNKDAACFCNDCDSH